MVQRSDKEEYLRRHQVPQILDSIVRSLLVSCPDDPISFLADYDFEQLRSTNKPTDHKNLTTYANFLRSLRNLQSSVDCFDSAAAVLQQYCTPDHMPISTLERLHEAIGESVKQTVADDRTERYTAPANKFVLEYQQLQEIMNVGGGEYGFNFGYGQSLSRVTPPILSDFAPPTGRTIEEEFTAAGPEAKAMYDYVVGTAEQKSMPSGAIRDLNNTGVTLQQFCSRPEAVKAGLTQEEVMSLRLYTGDAYRLLNTALRKSDRLAFSTTIRHACFAIEKLSKLSTPKKLYRGVRGALPPHMLKHQSTEGFVERDGYGEGDEHKPSPGGGIEAGFSSTTPDLSVAVKFGSDVLFEMTGTGAAVSWVSQFPAEEEFLLPPCTVFEVWPDGNAANGPPKEVARMYYPDSMIGEGLVTREHPVKTRTEKVCGVLTEFLTVKPEVPRLEDATKYTVKPKNDDEKEAAHLIENYNLGGQSDNPWIIHFCHEQQYKIKRAAELGVTDFKKLCRQYLISSLNSGFTYSINNPQEQWEAYINSLNITADYPDSADAIHKKWLKEKSIRHIDMWK